MKTKILIVLATVLVVLGFSKPTDVHAATRQRTTTLNLTDAAFTQDQSDSDEGWSWDVSERKLTLDNVDFEVDGRYEHCIVVPQNENVNIELIGTNKLTADVTGSAISFGPIGPMDYTTGVIIDGSGVLDVDTAQGIEVVTYTQKGGTVNLNGTLNAQGHFYMQGGNLNINTKGNELNGDLWFNEGIYVLRTATITGGNINVEAEGSAIFVESRRLTLGVDFEYGISITGGDLLLDSVISGIDFGWSSPANLIIDTEGTINFGNSPIGMYGRHGDIDFTKGQVYAGENTVLYSMADGNTDGQLNAPDADYTAVYEAMARIPSDLSVYTDESAKAVNDARAKVITGKNAVEQTTVDGYAREINAAVDGLQLKPVMSNSSQESAKAAKTGDNTMVDGYAFMGMVSLLGYALLKKKELI